MGLRQAWTHRGLPARLLWPVSQLYRALTALHRLTWRHGWRHAGRLPVPVVVVGNVVAGGAGKTPVTMALVQHLKARGWQPGVISRGYGRTTRGCQAVTTSSTAPQVGDEPLLIARRTRVPVCVAEKRFDAGSALLAAHPRCDILVCDDGLQHHALARDLEICVFNERGAGNGWLLPAGPLREPWPRKVDAVLYRGTRPDGEAPAFAIERQLAPYAITASGEQIALASLRGLALHAVAAIANPEDFFAMLRTAGLKLAAAEAHPDHYDFDGWQRLPRKGLQVICTEKDAVKLWSICPRALAVPLHTELPPAFLRWLDTQLAPLSSDHAGEPHGPETA